VIPKAALRPGALHPNRAVCKIAAVLKSAIRLPLRLAALLAGLAAVAAPGQDALRSSPSPTPARAVALDTAVSPKALWQADPSQFVETGKPLGFRWLSTAHRAAQSTRKGATLYGLPVCQTIVRTEDGKINDLTILFYNRGDSGEIGKEPFEALVRKAIEAVSKATGEKFTPRGRDASSAVKAEGIFWNTPDSTYLLEYSFTKEMKSQGIPFRAEFVRLEITPKEKPKSLLAEAREEQEKAAPFRGADHVVRDAASCDVSIRDIPMVDKGQKGYCVVASAERVLRYYGVRVDENELAQLANSSATEGTSVSAMTDSLRKLTARLKIRVRMLLKTDLNSLQTLVSDYNRAARRTRGEEIPSPGYEVDVSDIYRQMKPDLLRKARTHSKSGLERFDRNVRTNIDKGVPILWSVTLGVIPEGKHRLPVGGHMRLIIGYNDKSREIIYSDSWGMGNEFKRMPEVDAWSMTSGMATIEPV